MLDRLLPAGAFRLAAGYAVAVVVMLLLLARWLWGVTAGFVEDHLDRLIISEANVVTARFRRGHRDELIEEVNRTYLDRPVISRAILLTDERFRPLAGNLRAWPESVGDRVGWHVLFLMREAGPSEARILHKLLPDGSHLLLGYDLSEYSAGRKSFFVVLLGTSVPMAMGMLLLGWIARRALLTQVAAINTTAHAIVQGNLKERLTEQGTHSELGLLARTINRMLDQIEELVAGIANVSNSIAHDLRTPLAEARSRFDDLYEKLPTGSSMREEIAAGIANIDRLILTHESLLRLAQIESGARRSGIVSMDLMAVMDSVAELYGAAAEEKQQELRVEPAARVQVLGDSSLIAQAIGNLVDNAIKYTQPGGRIELCVAGSMDSAIRVIVRDTGPGIPETERSLVTARFYRGEGHGSNAGFGLGLSLVAAIAVLHGGELLLQDNEPGLRAVLVLGTDRRGLA